ncbi:hypothetical protein [Candidatus Parabeggiatoa sp. HSG14]|uniref:hypothetical protein n=1 Tax=Candidatus Parabeggiatoa sp. HSG14 TaxID=3055593 RepID=UPI0025A7113A|nr:hypothetical protein [Thiotrichales bacterium HSG14]
MTEQQRSIQSVPKTVKFLLILGLVLQMAWYYYLPPPDAEIQALSSPPKQELLRIFSLGDPIVSAKILMLWLQAFDNQSGQFLSYQQINYTTLQQWLEQILLLDPQSQYPLLAASHLYSSVKEKNKQRQILEFVYQQFFIDPSHRWPWLAHVTVLAKHQLKDLPLALKYAEAIATYATPEMPRWAQEMQIFILEDMGELERARLVIGGMLASGKLIDPNEIKFLNDKLLTLEKSFSQEKEQKY